MSLAYVHPLFSVILHYSRAEVPYTDLLFAPVESSPGSEIASYLDSWVQFFLLRECNFGFTKCFCCLFFVVLWLVGLFVVVMRFFLFAWDVSLWFCLVGFVWLVLFFSPFLASLHVSGQKYVISFTCLSMCPWCVPLWHPWSALQLDRIGGTGYNVYSPGSLSTTEDSYCALHPGRLHSSDGHWPSPSDFSGIANEIRET